MNGTYACIDLGSNMCRMLIGCPSKGKPLGFKIVKSCSILISLGKNSDVIDTKGVGRALKALEKCRNVLSQYSGVKVNCIATAIFRSASNAQEVLKSIYEKVGFLFRISDPGEEIMFSACGCKDIFLQGLSFVMDMGGGSTEIGLFERSKDSIKMLDWISLPYGLFYFGALDANHKPIPTDSYKALLAFLGDKKMLIRSKISMIICRSGIMTLIASYICRKQNIHKSLIHGRIFDAQYIIKSINSILQMSDLEILQQKLVSNTSHLSSTRGTMLFTREILRRLPVQFVILGNGGVKEGMMHLICNPK